MIVGLNGDAGAGKDTAANHLVKNYGYTRYAFADAVRDVALAINPILASNWVTSEDEVNPKLQELRIADIVNRRGWDWAKRHVPEARRLLQVIGTEAGRMLLGTNVWVDILDKKWKADGCPDAVITDFRFPNEHDFITENGGKTVKLVRVNNPDAISKAHASEQYSPECDYVLIHQGNDLDELYTLVDGLAASLDDSGIITWDRIANDKRTP